MKGGKEYLGKGATLTPFTWSGKPGNLYNRRRVSGNKKRRKVWTIRSCSKRIMELWPVKERGALKLKD